MLKFNIVEMLNMENGDKSNGLESRIVLGKISNKDQVKNAIVKLLNEMDIYDEEQTSAYPTSKTLNYYTEEDLSIVVDLVMDFGSNDISELDKTIYFI